MGSNMVYLEHRLRRFECHVQRKERRDMYDRFDFYYTEFLKLYRVNTNIAMDLIDIILKSRLELERQHGLIFRMSGMYITLCIYFK